MNSTSATASNASRNNDPRKTDRRPITRGTLGIVLLSVTAAVMSTLLLTDNSSAGPVGTQVMSDRGDFSVATARVQNGGDALYIMDKRRGLLAVFTYDNASQTLRVRASEPVARAFGNLQNQPGRPR